MVANKKLKEHNVRFLPMNANKIGENNFTKIQIFHHYIRIVHIDPK